MKKIVALVLVLAMVLALAACGSVKTEEPVASVQPESSAFESSESIVGESSEAETSEIDEPMASESSEAVISDSDQTDADTYTFDFSENAEMYLKNIGDNYSNRQFGEEGHNSCLDWIQEELIQAGYDESNLIVDEFEIGDGTGKNLLLKIEGADTTKQIIVGAHYDGYGIGDNGSGIALLLATACGLVNETPDVNVVYAFFDAEEIGDNMLGSKHYVECMTEEEIANTLFMINIDAIAAGDYCNIYGGVTQGETVVRTEGYELAMNRAEQLGLKVYRTADLDGYYQEYEAGPEMEENALYSNPWTAKNPAPNGTTNYLSPATGDWSDHAPFMSIVPYIYFEATNWYVGQYEGECETGDEAVGVNGRIMNTEYDNVEYLEEYFPGRVLSHFQVYSPLLSSLMLHPYE